ncbi:sulfite exporter TauE/SafE family protein [Fibrella aquatilis]|uniref:Probable membrane transporter protein n=1 Tax=Fibrella aquatilis TaxID=2817059 RepID=A0A939JWA9_9BACT|nr:sulfite exporter TauE/SafE family protein [Fibrella aquatilis]MBO0931717.1 sulfite exporter TauE/SafE family protein [Fibrella aquatilis]
MLIHGLLFISALLGGGLNALAGGGTFLTFPALTFSGLPLLQANATSTVALWPGSLSSAVALYRDWIRYQGQLLVWLSICLVGGLTGALLLLRLSPDVLGTIFPYLLLTATGLFAFRSRLEKQEKAAKPAPDWMQWLTIFAVAVYGGFFGGGIGILFMAMFSLLGMRNVHHANALKVLFASFVNGISIVTFVVSGVVVWSAAGVMVGGSILGGYLGARFAQRIPAHILRIFVILVGLLMTGYFFFKQS